MSLNSIMSYILENFHIISDNSVNEKLALAENNSLKIEDRYLPSLQRYLSGDSRTKTLENIHKYLAWVEEVIKSYELNYIVKKLEEKKDVKMHKFEKDLVDEIRNNLTQFLKFKQTFQTGLEGLAKNYVKDSKVKYEIEKIVNRFDRVIQSAEKIKKLLS